MEANQIINQFDLLNRTRIARLSKLVSHKQQAFFSIFPFLIHTNLPELPGYAGQECPEGIMEYQVSDKTVYDTKRLHKQFKYKRQAVRHFGFTSLYLINRYGL